MGSAQSQRRHSGIDAVHTSFDTLHQAHGSQAGSIMGMQLNRQIHRFFQRFDQIIRLIGREKSRHILDADRISACIGDLLGVLHVIFVGEHRAGRIGNSDLCVSAFLFGGLNGNLQIFDVVQSVKNTDDVNACLLYTSRCV